MNKIFYLLISTAIVSCSATTRQEQFSDSEEASVVEAVEQSEDFEPVEVAPMVSDIPDGAKKMMAAYPDKVVGYRDNHLVMSDSSLILYDDGKKKSFAEMLDNSDVEDTFYADYDTSKDQPDYLEDPGRSRSEALFKSMYGKSQAEVGRKLVKVDWFGQRISFTSVNGAADSLRAVAAEFKARPDLQKHLKGASTFYWRNVRGANRLSAHSYGIAIDINVAQSDYWLWKYPKRAETDKINYHNRISMEVVEVFERHGFIWGGRWYHFDTMHFEFRPEFFK